MRRGSRLFGVSSAVLVLALLTGCASNDPDPASLARGREHGRYSGPLLGRHELLASVAIDNPTNRSIRVVKAAPADPYNVVTEDAWAMPLRTADSNPDEALLGVLRWPRDPHDHDTVYNALNHVRPATGFVLPAQSHNRWAIVLRMRQHDLDKSMRTGGTQLTYTLGGHDHTVTIPTALCFTTAADTTACSTTDH